MILTSFYKIFKGRPLGHPEFKLYKSVYLISIYWAVYVHCVTLNDSYIFKLLDAVFRRLPSKMYAPPKLLHRDPSVAPNDIYNLLVDFIYFAAHIAQSFSISATVSTWLDTSILMSEPPNVRGNKSSRFHLKISKFASSASSPLVRGNISTISGNPCEMGLFRESCWPIVSTLIGSASAWDFIASTLIPAILPCAPPNKLVYFISINNAHHSILIVYKSSRITSHVTCSHQDGFVDSIRRLDSI